MDIVEKIRLLEVKRDLLQKINNYSLPTKLTGYEIAVLVKDFLSDNQVDSFEFFIKIQGQALYIGDGLTLSI